ncbi:hypothetical protein [Halobellus clavatus]|uniref:Uncharacterized protein n=1 Tax=Halobellus clavatus TaxID=660517 RepID=A0A1H3GZ10_9EURY|nr:hypothetical protein [Halobellus clavatus]SDY08310.1 hypothetical protein SAMN04487946_10653 [Halobellus clavatus]
MDPGTAFVLLLFGLVTVPIFLGVVAFLNRDTDGQQPERRDEELAQRIRTVTRRLDDLERQVADLEQQVDAVAQRVEDLDTERT